MRDPFSPEKVKKVDAMNVEETYSNWPELARAGLKTSSGLERGDYRKVYVLGMGGSAAAGDLLASWLLCRHGIETEVCKGVIPASEMSGCLAIVCSASGMTEETISMMKTAMERHATLVSTSHGGRLAAESKSRGVPHVQMPEIVAPRYMLPFMVFSCLSAVDSALGLDSVAEAEGAISGMRRLWNKIEPCVPPEDNPSKEIALRLMKKTAAIYGTHSTRGVGIRFKNEMNENSKKFACYVEMPELFHNEIEAWDNPREDFVPVLLRDRMEGKRDSRLADSFAEILSSMKKGPIQVRMAGDNYLCRLMTMVYELDMVSYFVAIGNCRDPSPTPLIVRLKKTA
jgi:glucose/mannose-6-phosphate isomerase